MCALKRKAFLALPALLLCVLLLALPLCPAAHADNIAESGIGEDIPWVLTDQGALIIGNGGTVIIPGAANRTASSYTWDPWRSYIRSVSFTGSVEAHGSIAEMFRGCVNLTSINFSGFKTDDIDDCSRIFMGCSSLTQLDLSTFNMADIQKDEFFVGMSSLERLVLDEYSLSGTGFDTLGHLWGCSDDSFATAYSSGNIVSNYGLSITARTFERVFRVDYQLIGGSPTTSSEVVRISSASSYPLLVPSTLGGYSAPVDREFKSWMWETTPYSAGSAVNLRSFSSDTVTFSAVWRAMADWNWATDGSSATATKRGDVPVSQTDYSPVIVVPDNSTCTSMGTIGKRATVSFGDDVYTDDHFYDVPAHHTLEYHPAQPAQCTVDGNIEYWHCTRTCGNNFSSANALPAEVLTNVVVPATGHAWGPPLYTWAANNGTVSARRICANNNAHVYPGNQTVAVSSTVLTPATCTTVGTTRYTSNAFADPVFSVQTKDLNNIPALGHTWGEPTYTWAADNGSVTARRICGRNASHIDSETVNTTVQVFPPACLTAGLSRYTAVFTKAAFSPQIRNVYGDPALGHELRHHAAAEATCTTAGNIEYWECTRCGEYFSDSAGVTEILDRSSVLTPALGHDFQEQWLSDAQGHWHVCSRCNASTGVQAHIMGRPPTVENAARCVVCGYEMAPRLLVQARAYFGESGDLALATVTYTKQRILDDSWIVQLPWRTPQYEGHYFEGWLVSSDNGLYSPRIELPFTYAERRAVIVRGVWTEIVGEGSHELEADTRYRFDTGAYQVAGDACVYPGEQPFYPADSAQVDVTKAG